MGLNNFSLTLLFKDLTWLYLFLPWFTSNRTLIEILIETLILQPIQNVIGRNSKLVTMAMTGSSGFVKVHSAF